MNDTGLHDAKHYEAHDLLRLCDLPDARDRPDWLPDAFARAPFAVVRRAQAPAGFVAVGFRGTDRAQRYGTFVEHAAVEAVLSPEHLRDRAVAAQRRTLKAFAALHALVEDACLDERAWGPTGSVGFELATMQPTATGSSDLDIVIRTPAPLSREDGLALRERVTRIERSIGVRIDAQLETPAGAIALSEWASGKQRVMARAAHGPSLIADPWQRASSRPEGPR